MEINKFLNGGVDAKWYTLPSSEGQEKPVKLLLNTPKPIRKRQLRKQAEKSRFNGKEITREVDLETLYELLRDEVIQNWENIEKDGQPLECNTENKKLLDDNWEEFNTLWNNVFAQGNALESALLELDQKN